MSKEGRDCFERFASIFSLTFGDVIAFQVKYRGQFDVPSASRRRSHGRATAVSFDRVQDTLGHPSEVLSTLAGLLLDFVKPWSDGASLDAILHSSFSSVALRSELFCAETASVSSSASEMSEIDIDENAPASPTLARQQFFLAILRCMCLCLFWTKNVVTLKHLMGKNFVIVFLDILRCLVDRMEAGQQIESLTKMQNNVSEMFFLHNCLLYSIQFLANSSPSAWDVSLSTCCGVLPRMPWSPRVLQDLFWSFCGQAPSTVFASESSRSLSMQTIEYRQHRAVISSRFL